LSVQKQAPLLAVKGLNAMVVGANPAEALRNLPSGVLTLDGQGRIVLANAAAERLLGPLEGKRCCDVFGCRRPDGPFGPRCVLEVIAEGQCPATEILVRPRASAVPRPVWLAGARLDAGEGAVLQIRPASAADAAAEPAHRESETLLIEVLGPTRVLRGERDVGGAWLRHRPGQILKFLAGRRDYSASVDEIAAALWPEHVGDSSGVIRHFVHSLRQQLEPNRERRSRSLYVVAHRGGYALDTHRVRVDAGLFEQHVRTGAAAYLNGETAIAVSTLEYALDLYTGDFVQDEPYAEWALAERDRLRHLASEACRMLTQVALDSGDLDRAVTRAEQLVALDPFDDAVQRALLLIYLRAGRRTAAMRRYAQIRTQMRRQFGEEPSFDLRELATAAPDQPLRLA
jgi:DNA-binding SARP family transcriptional activator